MDTPLVLTHDHDPRVVFGGQFPHLFLDSLEPPADPPPSYDALWTNFQHISRAYNNLLAQHRDLADAHHVLRDELNGLRDTYWTLRVKHQELVDDVGNARIQSWRHVVRVEELEKELRLLRHGEIHSASAKRKFADIEQGDNDGAASDWSASTRSHSSSPSNDALTTPASGSSKIASALPTKDEPSEDYISFGAQLIVSSCEIHSSEIRTPKRRRDNKPGLNYSRLPADPDTRPALVSPFGKASHQEDTSPEANSKRIPHARRTPPQTRSGTRSSRRRRPSVKVQNTTAAAVAAALSEAAVHCRDRSCSPFLGG